MHATHNTLSENVGTQSAEIVNRRLAAAIDLHGQLKQAHWNVRGSTFIAIHELFDKVAGEAESYSDLLAERAAGLGAVAEGTVQVAAERSFLIAYPLRITDEKEHIFEVAAAFGQSAREVIGQSAANGDADTAADALGLPRISGGLVGRSLQQIGELAKRARAGTCSTSANPAPSLKAY